MPLGGKLVLKGGISLGEKKKKKRKREGEAEDKGGDASKTEGTEAVEETKSVSVEEPQDGLTDAQRKHLKKLEERDMKNIKRLVNKTHRERVEEFNSYLGSLTEHNDIPRVSAAGNG